MATAHLKMDRDFECIVFLIFLDSPFPVNRYIDRISYKVLLTHVKLISEENRVQYDFEMYLHSLLLAYL